jgi:hypothetical protein
MFKIFGLGKGTTFKSDRLENELVRTMEEEKLSFLGKKYAPSRYLIFCNSEEHRRIRLLEQEFLTQYESFLKERIEKKKYLLAGTKIEIKLEVDEDLAPGEYRVEAFLDKAPQEKPVEEKPKDKPEKRSSEKDKSLEKDKTVRLKRSIGEEKTKTEVVEPEDKTKVMPRGKLIVMSGNEKAEHRITKNEVIVGRDGDIAIRDENGFVSSKHFKLMRRDGDFWIKDFDSTNGTEVNDKFITEQKLEDGDMIRIGEIELKYNRR